MNVSWVEGPWLALDTETTGVNTDTDRIVTAALLVVPAGAREPSRVWEWVVDPGVNIPAEAAAINGYTTERVQREGSKPTKVLPQLLAALLEYWTPPVPLVVANAHFDLSLLDAECRRHLHMPLRLSGYVLDPMVIDRRLDKYRKGSRKLHQLCDLYQVELTEAHTSKADALAALLVMRRLLEVFPDITRRSLQQLHHYQKAWRREWAEHYEVYSRSEARRRGAPEAEISAIVIERDWPVRSRIPVVAR